MKKILNTKLKDMKAITLIALVITIVILIILAGVLVSITLGNNGLFNKAKLGKELYANAQDYEDTQIAKTANQIDNYVNYSRTGYDGIVIDTLWHNNSSTENFSDTTLPIDLSQYSKIAIKVKDTTDSTEEKNYKYFVVSKNTSENYYLGYESTGANYAYTVRRCITITSNSVYFSNATFKQGDHEYSEYNQYFIPVEIYGIK